MRTKLSLPHAVAFLLLLAGAALTAWGLSQIGRPVQGRNLLVWLGVFGVVAAMVFGAKLRPASAGLLLAAAFTLACGQLLPVLVVGWFAAASVLVGAFALRHLGCHETQASPLTSFLVGAGFLGTLAGLMAHYPINYPGVYAIGLAIPLVLGRRRLVRWMHAAADLRRGGGVLAPLTERWLESAIVVAALLHFAIAFVPEIGYDALAMHLFVAEALRNRHQWGFDVDLYVWAVLPLLVDWIYTIVNMLGGESAARLVNVCFVFALAALVRELVRWAGGNRIAERWALLIFLVTPLTFTESSSLFIEGGWSAFLVAGMLAMLKVLDGSAGSKKEGIPVAGLLFGFALASKAVTLALLPAMFLVMLARPSAWLGASHVRPLLKGLAFGAAIGGVPYVTAWVITGNPVFPFFDALFKSPFYILATLSSFGFSGVNFEPPPFERYLTWNTIYRVTFDSPRYLEGAAGAAGFQWLTLLVPCAVLLVLRAESRRRALVLLVLGVAGVAGVFQQTAYLRYVFPALAVLIALVGVGLGHLSTVRGAIVWTSAAAGVALLNIVYFHVAASYPNFPLDAALSPAPRAELVASRHPLRAVVPVVNELDRINPAVVWVADPQATGLAGDALYPGWYNFRFMNEFANARTEQQMVELMNRRGADIAVVDPQWNLAHFVQPSIDTLLKVTEEVASSGPVSVRRLKASQPFTRELAASPDFADPSAWTLVPGARYDAAQQAMVVVPQAAAFQRVAVVPGRKYLNTHSSRCEGADTLGRLQLNWLDASNRHIAVSSKSYRCRAAWDTHTLEVRAPRDAVAALVFTSGHVGGPVTVKLNSFKSR